MQNDSAVSGVIRQYDLVFHKRNKVTLWYSLEQDNGSNMLLHLDGKITDICRTFNVDYFDHLLFGLCGMRCRVQRGSTEKVEVLRASE